MDQFYTYLTYRWQVLLGLMGEHALVVVIAVAIATVIAVTIGFLVYRTERPAGVALTIANIFVTIPSFALFSLFIPVLGLGYPPTVVALVMYALLPIVSNTITGLREVDPAVTESARGMGMTKWQILFRIELPLAWPVIVTGIRVSTLLVIGIAAIAAYVNGPGLGKPIFSGLARMGTARGLDLALGGTLGIVILAILFDIVLTIFTRLTTPRGIV
jgi:osmoprotectant transport system permease protein